MLDCEKIEAARELLAGGRTMSAAARTLGIPRSTLVGTLQREGKTLQGRGMDKIVECYRRRSFRANWPMFDLFLLVRLLFEPPTDPNLPPILFLVVVEGGY